VVSFTAAGTCTIDADQAGNASFSAATQVQQSFVVATAPGVATHLTVSIAANPTIAGAAHSVTVTVLDANGNIATGYSGTIHFNASEPAATVPANYTFTAADAGVHTFSYLLSPVVFRTAGTQALRARDTMTGTITGVQTGIVVTPAAATHLVVSVAANPWLAGSVHSVTVRALDAYGNIATGYRGTIHFNTSDLASSVPANYTFTAADAGVHTFSYLLSPGLVLRTPGTQAVRARDTMTGTITGVQTGIVVQ